MKASRPCLAALLLLSAAPLRAQTFQPEEATIAQLHEAIRNRLTTCRAVVDHYLRRIQAYDKQGPGLNAIVTVNPGAEQVADSLDRRFAAGGPTGPLHCVTVIVKENMETVELPTTAGSLALQGFHSTRDAFLVRRLKAAGAIVLAKSNMAELAFSPYETVSSILPGYSRNPYSLDRVTAGSSGGSAAAVAASFAAVGLGTDTGNSIRGPSAHQALAGIRSTMGLTSRAGIVPLNLAADIAGPMTRTVEDAARVFQSIVGEDPDDPVTAAARGRTSENYAAALVADGLRGARIGVLRQAYERETTDAEVVQVFTKAVDDLRRGGATIVDPARVEGLDNIRRAQGLGACMGFKYDINRYLAGHGDKAPVKSLAEIVKSGRFHPTVQRRLEQANDGVENGPDTPACKSEMEYREQVRGAVLKLMGSQKLDALVYPTWSNPPRLIGDLNTPHGDNSQFFSPTTGFPSIQVPMGYTRGVLPAGITFFGRAWSEATLIRLAYSYEHATMHRVPPFSTPPLR